MRIKKEETQRKDCDNKNIMLYVLFKNNFIIILTLYKY